MENVSNLSLEKQLYSIFCETVTKYELLSGIEKVVFLFSGGKDATLGLFFLNKYIKEKKLPVSLEALMVAYPKHVYYLEDGTEADCFVETKRFWEEQQVNVKVFDSEECDFKDDEKGACKICKNARKAIVDGYLDSYIESGNTAIVTGYTLYDALAYMDEICLVSNFDFNNISLADVATLNRVKNCLHKMKAKEKLPNGLTIIRPLIAMKENMIMDAVINLNIPYISRGCKAATNKHKREYFKVLNVAAPIDNATYEGLLDFLAKINIDLPETFEDVELGNYFTDC